jgi:excinuclease UvrABC ATPase subunit
MSMATRSAFGQGVMPTLARPDVDVIEGLTTAIIVDQQRMGADARSTVGTATGANEMLLILFSRLGQPHIGSPNAFSATSRRSAWAGRSRSSRAPGRPRNACQAAHVTVARVPHSNCGEVSNPSHYEEVL